MWILSMAPSVSILIEFDSINILRKLAHDTWEYKVCHLIISHDINFVHHSITEQDITCTEHIWMNLIEEHIRCIHRLWRGEGT